MDTKDLIFYEVYPTSFYDSNDDGIGDLKGIEQKLDYIKDLGCNAIWINPFFKSPFKDGGYDVEDFFDVDPKFGTIEDFKSLLRSAHEKGIKIINDLVIGHASIYSKIFLESAKPEINEFSDLFIWTDSVWENSKELRLISGLYDRDGAFMVNFFSHQAAFNLGFNEIKYPWQMSYKDKRTLKTREFILKIMRFWLDLGVDGFRVDMADCLVKQDKDLLATIETWKWFFSIIRKEYPNAYFVSEWDWPEKSLEAGFDADFVLDCNLNFYHHLARSSKVSGGPSLLNGADDIDFIVNDMKERFTSALKRDKHIALISGNHDCERISNLLDIDRLKMFYIFMYSMPGNPFLYYGDELMMRSKPLVSKDGGYQRTSSRTPMIWDNNDKNHGFSNTSGKTYLPFFDMNTLSIEDAKKDPTSLLNFIKKMIGIRKECSDLTGNLLEIRNAHRVLVIERGNLKLYLNCSTEDYIFDGEIIISSKDITNNILPPFTAVLAK